MLNDFTGADCVFIACGYTDLRRGIDGLASIVQSQFRLDPFTNTLFLFCGRRRDRIKALYWEGNGFVLLYKRLESGAFQWPKSEDEAWELTAQQYRWLMEGLQIDQPKAHKAVKGLSVIQAKRRIFRHCIFRRSEKNVSGSNSADRISVFVVFLATIVSGSPIFPLFPVLLFGRMTNRIPVQECEA